MAVLKAGFVEYSDEKAEQIKNADFSLVRLDEQTEKIVRQEMADWSIMDYSSYVCEYDDYNDKSTGSSISHVPVGEMTSCCSRDYGSDDVRGDILVKDGHFVGVVIFTTEELCSSWSKYRNIYYSLLFIDGKVDGKPIKTYTFSGESSSKDYTNEYSLVKNEK